VQLYFVLKGASYGMNHFIFELLVVSMQQKDLRI